MNAAQQIRDVAIVSAFGRGDLLATELKSRGLSVTLVDVSQALGMRGAPDLEGPFPVVRPNPLLPTHLEWLMNHAFEELTNGVSLWLPSGPIELRGALSDFYAARRPEVAVFRDYFWAQSPSSKRNDGVDKLSPQGFGDNWITEFSHSFCSNQFSTSTDCHTYGEPFPFLQAAHVPLFRQERMEDLQKDMQSSGVEWIKVESIQEIEIERGRLIGVAVPSGMLRADHYVWCLSSEETDAVSRALAKKLFPKGIATARWVWRRFQVHTPKNSLDNVVPPYVVMVGDIYFPWAYDNMIVMKRRKSGLADVWVRLPTENSKKPDQLKKFTKKIEDRLKERFGGLQHEVEPFWDEGAPLYPVFEPEQLQAFAKPALANLTLEGPEVLTRQDWAGRFQVQTTTMLTILAKRKKEKGDDLAVHAP